MTDTANKADVDVLFPEKSFEVNGEQITVRPFYFGEFPKVVKLLQPILTTLANSQLLRVTTTEGGEQKLHVVVPENIVEVMSNLMLDSSEPLIDLLSFATGKPTDWFDTLPFDKGVELSALWFEVNKDFFVRRVVPLMKKLYPTRKKDGDESSQTSSVPDIVVQKSTDQP